MSVTALTLSAYIVSLGDNIQDNDHKRIALSETPVKIHFQNTEVKFSHQNWKVLDSSVCAHLHRDTKNFSDCTISAKSLFQQICTGLTNKSSPYWHHHKYKEMYCDSAVNYIPKVATISYGEDTQMSDIEKKCNQLILKAMISGTKKDNDEKKAICQNVK